MHTFIRLCGCADTIIGSYRILQIYYSYVHLHRDSILIFSVPSVTRQISNLSKNDFYMGQMILLSLLWDSFITDAYIKSNVYHFIKFIVS